MKTYRAVAALVAFAFVFAAPLLYVSGLRPSAFENRPLVAAPDPASGWKFFDSLAPWASDHLPGRREAVRANSWIDYFVLGTLPRSSATLPSTVGARAGQDSSRSGNARAPQVVQGRNGYLFLGEDFDSACFAGSAFRRNLHQLAALARVIEASGRQVVFSVAPNKSAVTTDSLPRVTPHGGCAERGLVHQNAVLDAFHAPHWVEVRARLAAAHQAGEQVFWKDDTHWTTVAGEIYARALAGRLDPNLGDRIRTRRTEVSRLGDLFVLAGLTFKERAPGVRLSAGGAVTELPGGNHFDPLTVKYGVNKWRTEPSAGLIEGKSLIVGDSFSYYVLGTLRPLFARGTFFWTAHSGDNEALIDQIEQADTVVLELAQRTVRSSGYALVSPAFRAQVAARLGVRAK